MPRPPRFDATSEGGALPPHRWSRRQVIGGLGAAGLLAAGGAVGLTACGSSSDPEPDDQSAPVHTGTKAVPSRARTASTPPNVLLIVADDMRYDQVPFLPNVGRLLVDQGQAFTQARCNVPLCQPSRVGYLTGQTSKHNGELEIFLETALKDHDNCLPWWMNRAGYRCGLFGKYLNAIDPAGGIDPPRGYATWREILIRSEDPPDRVGFDVRTNEGVTSTDLYESDYLTEEVARFIGDGEPFFAILTPTLPHGPYAPRPDLADAFSDLEVEIVEEDDMSDKPYWMRKKPALTDADRAKVRSDSIGALQELLAVDQMVGDLLDGMDPEVLANTLVIFTSDNGVHHAEHRRLGDATKGGPYDVSLRVPLLVRGPGFPHGPDVDVASLAMQDITATILAAGGATAGLPDQAGIPLQDLAADPGRHRDRALLHETSQGWEGLPGDGVTTTPDHPLGFRKLYRYPSVRSGRKEPFIYECYDLDTDPDELESWGFSPDRVQERNQLESLLESLLA